MSLRYASEPTNGTLLVKQNLQRLVTRPNPLSEKGVDVGSLAIQTPVAVYDLRADDIAAGKGLDAARFTSFRYLIGSADKPVAAAEVITDPSGSSQGSGQHQLRPVRQRVRGRACADCES